MRQNEDLPRNRHQRRQYRILAYAVCCAFGGLGGAFFAAYLQNIYPSTYSVTDPIYFMLYCFLGGLDFIFGAVARLPARDQLRAAARSAGIPGPDLWPGDDLFILWLPNGILSLSLRRAAAADEEVDVPPTGSSAEKEAAE